MADRLTPPRDHPTTRLVQQPHSKSPLLSIFVRVSRLFQEIGKSKQLGADLRKQFGRLLNQLRHSDRVKLERVEGM